MHTGPTGSLILCHLVCRRTLLYTISCQTLYWQWYLPSLSTKLLGACWFGNVVHTQAMLARHSCQMP